jgi:DNA repair protein RecN (Recombination protein N)
MAAARFTIELTPLAEISAAGAEDVEFRIAVNAGFEPRPLSRVASGGELSRVMLALKTELAPGRHPDCHLRRDRRGDRRACGERQVARSWRVAEQHQVFVVHAPAADRVAR